MIGGSFGMALTQKGKYIVSFYDKNPKLTTINIKNHLEYYENREFISSFDLIIDATGNSHPLNFKVPTINIASVQYQSKIPRVDVFEKLHCFIASYIDKNLVDKFIYCHPLCGSEKSGHENARVDLFENQNCIITTEGRTQELIDFATEIFKDIGMNVFHCETAEEHNKNLAYTSHLLHYLAFNDFADLHPVLERLSHSNKEMWEGIFEANKKNIDDALLKFTKIAVQKTGFCIFEELKKPNYFTMVYQELVKDIPEYFYGTALKQLLK